MATTIHPTTVTPGESVSTEGNITEPRGAHSPHRVWAALALVLFTGVALVSAVLISSGGGSETNSNTGSTSVSAPMLDPVEVDFITRAAPVGPTATQPLLDPIEVDFITQTPQTAPVGRTATQPLLDPIEVDFITRGVTSYEGSTAPATDCHSEAPC